MTNNIIGNTENLEQKLENVYRTGASTKFGYKDITQQQSKASTLDDDAVSVKSASAVEPRNLSKM